MLKHGCIPSLKALGFNPKEDYFKTFEFFVQQLFSELVSFYAMLFCKAYESLSERQANLTRISRTDSEATIAKITGFSYFIKTANAI